jgi:hypothetical protein
MVLGLRKRQRRIELMVMLSGSKEAPPPFDSLEFF